MQALSLWQPWAQLVVLGAKRIDTRSWSTRWRGWIWIHASKKITKVGRQLANEDPIFREALAPWIFSVLPRGEIVGAVSLDAILRTEQLDDNRMTLMGIYGATRISIEREFGDFTPGRYGWYLKHPFQLSEPFEIKGSLGLWTPKSVPQAATEEFLDHQARFQP